MWCKLIIGLYQPCYNVVVINYEMLIIISLIVSINSYVYIFCIIIKLILCTLLIDMTGIYMALVQTFINMQYLHVCMLVYNN